MTSAAAADTTSRQRRGYGKPPICAGIVGHADLAPGARVKEILEAMIASGGGRFRGIRFISASHPDQAQWGSVVGRPEKLLLDKRVREGFAQLAPLGLSFDAFMYHTQLGDLIDLARLSGNSDRPEPCRWPDRAWPLQGQNATRYSPTGVPASANWRHAPTCT
jgi:predicted TIM-barrel fold metal-dependent hydrolase